MVKKTEENWPFNEMGFEPTNPKHVAELYSAFGQGKVLSTPPGKSEFVNLLKMYVGNGTLRIISLSEKLGHAFVRIESTTSEIIDHEVADSLNKAFENDAENWN